MRYFVVCSYDGTNFIGWQHQVEGRSIQDEIEKVLSDLPETIEVCLNGAEVPEKDADKFIYQKNIIIFVWNLAKTC